MPDRHAIAALAMCIALMTGTAHAEAVTYQCVFADQFGRSERQVFVQVDEAQGSARVSGDEFRSSGKNTFPARLHSGKARLTVGWTNSASDSSGQRARLDITLVIFRGRSDAVLRVKPFGYVNDFSEKGTCTRAKG